MVYNAFENVHTLHIGLFDLSPFIPLEIPVLVQTFLLKVWLLRQPFQWNFKLPYMKWVAIFYEIT